jgi:hypothetical protein
VSDGDSHQPLPPMKNPPSSPPSPPDGIPSQESIGARAYQIWQEAGHPAGSHEAHWRQAERELTPGNPGVPVATSAPTGGPSRPGPGPLPTRSDPAPNPGSTTPNSASGSSSISGQGATASGSGQGSGSGRR